MILNNSQREAVNYQDNTLIIACPGSGKTRTLVGKLLHVIEEVRNTSRRIVCITYTNAAVHEIESRLRRYGRSGDDDYCDVSTIHSFCLINILGKFYWHIPEYVNGFKVITPENDEFREIAENLLNENSLPLQMVDYFESFNREPDGTPIVPEDVPPSIALTFWDRLQKQGFIDFPNIIYYAYRLLLEKPSISFALSCKYAWFLIDEFQDTTELQVDILRLLAKQAQSKLFLVGDPYQSIFGFAGARVELMEEFGREIKAETKFSLLENYRSSNLIIGHAEKLCPRKPPMYGVGEDAKLQIEPVYIHRSTAFEAITDYFLPALEEQAIPYGKAAILAPWWIKLYQLGRKLREFGVPIVGPGSRPYRRSHLFATLAEQMCAFLFHPTNKVFHQIERELFLMLISITGRSEYRIFTYEGNITVRKLIASGNEIYRLNQKATDWLKLTAESCLSILIKDNFLSAVDDKSLIESASGMIADMARNGVDLQNLSVEDLGLFASTERNLHLITMHKAKGREFDAVAIIDLHDGRIPDFRAINRRDEKQIEENKRLLYVSITRARRFLMYVTDSEHFRNIPSRFLAKGCLCLT